MTHLIVGLGNPGEEYEDTRHNVGFMIIDSLPCATQWYEKKKNVWKEARLEAPQKAILVRPLTFMNASGTAVAGAAKSHKVKPENILIIHDDLDIELGRAKMTFDRSAALHKGAESVIKSLRTQKFWRLRVGIAPKKKPDAKVMKDFLLKKMTGPQEKKMLEQKKKIHEGIFLWLEDHGKGMQHVNTV